MISKNRTEQTISFAQMNLLFRIRALLRDLATWTREYLISTFVTGSYNEEAFTRLYSIPTQLSTLLQYVFGNEASEKSIQLLSNHLILLREYIEALKSNNVDAANENYKNLYSNADELAKFLASINPFWNEVQWRNMFYTYLNRTVEEIAAFMTRDYKKNIDIFDRLLAHTESMGDYFTLGLYNYITFNQNNNITQSPTQAPPKSTNYICKLLCSAN